MELQGKRIIVTGSARGMGAATVRSYVQAGADVIGMDVSDEAGAAVSAQAAAAGPGRAEYLHVDVADRQSVETAFAEAAERLGGLDVLAHPAAIQRSSDAGDVSVEDWGPHVRGQCAGHHADEPGCAPLHEVCRWRGDH